MNRLCCSALIIDFLSIITGCSSGHLKKNWSFQGKACDGESSLWKQGLFLCGV